MDFSGRNKEGKTEPHELTWIPCLPSWSSFPKQHLESQVQFRQSWSLFTTMNPWHWRWSRTPMFKLPPSPTAHEMKRSFPGRCLCVCIFLMGLSFLKTLKSSLPCHTLYLTFHFLMTTFNNLYHPEFPLSPYTFIFYLQDTYFSCSLQRLAFVPQNGFSAAPSVSVWLPLPPPSFSLSPLLCSLLSKPHRLPVQSHARSLIHSLLYVHTVPFVIQSCTLASDLSTALKSHFPLGASLDSTSFLSTYESGQLIKIWT